MTARRNLGTGVVRAIQDVVVLSFDSFLRDPICFSFPYVTCLALLNLSLCLFAAVCSERGEVRSAGSLRWAVYCVMWEDSFKVRSENSYSLQPGQPCLSRLE